MKCIKNITGLLILFTFIRCGTSETKPAAEHDTKVTTPVTVVSVENRPISEVLNFKSVSAYQKKNAVKANVTGFIEKSFLNIGDHVALGKTIYTVKTKEAKALSKYMSNDSLFAFKGESQINAPSSGVVTEVDKHPNDYINDGDQLCVIAEQNSFVFLLNVPFEQNKYAGVGKSVSILLPDSTMIEGTISSKLSTIDPASQTQVYVVKPHNSSMLSENLSAIVQLNKSTRQNAQVLNKSCVLADETMENYWVMKLINDSTAIKVPVQKGITDDSKIEILSPQFNTNDRIINTGNYGLGDTALVKIIKPGEKELKN